MAGTIFFFFFALAWVAHGSAQLWKVVIWVHVAREQASLKK